MNSSTPPSTTSTTTRNPTTTALLAALIRRAADDPNLFLPLGLPAAPAELHRAMQDFLSTHRRALIELPRDHGKTTQACLRIVWELGRNPGLRVKLVCATDALAAERTRFLRNTIERNPLVRLVFPRLLPASPWTAEAFTVAAFAVMVENGRFRLKADGMQAELFREMMSFPFGDRDDLVDASATGTAYLLKGFGEPRI